MLRRVDRVPRVTRHPPADRRLVLQRVQVLGLAAQQVEHRTALEQAAQFALTDEARKVGAEQRREDRVGLGVEHRLHDRSRVDLAEGHRLLDELDAAGLPRDHLLLERGGGRLPVLVVGVDDRPALLRELRRFRRQHRRLHVGRGAQPERVPVAVFPDDLVGERLGGKEQHLTLFGEVGHGKPDVRRECPHQHDGLFAREEFLGHADRIAWVAVVVARHDFERPPEHTSRRIDLGQRQLHAPLVRLQERREHLVAVELAEPDRLRHARQRQRGNGGERAQRGNSGKTADRVHGLSRGRPKTLLSYGAAINGRNASTVDRNMGVILAIERWHRHQAPVGGKR